MQPPITLARQFPEDFGPYDVVYLEFRHTGTAAPRCRAARIR
jgi:hypothetical protein